MSPTTPARRAAVASWLRDPVAWSRRTQLAKTVLAAVLAWLLASEVFGLPQSFLAPWAALLVVHATVYRTFSLGMRQVVGAVLGVLLAWAVGQVLGLDSWAVVVVLAVGLAIGSARWFAEEETAVAATALIVLTTGFAAHDAVLLSRLADTGIGIAVGLLVNAAVWPPLRRRTAVAAVDRVDDAVGRLLSEVAEGVTSSCDDAALEDWVERTRELDGEVDEAWALVRQARESAWMNPRRSARTLRDPREWNLVLHRLEQAVAETRSLLRTLGHPATRREEWEEPFRSEWPRLLAETGEAVQRADPARLAAVHADLDRLVDTLGRGRPASRLWPVEGALVINLRNIAVALDAVARANPLEQPPLPFSAWRSRGPRGAFGPLRRRQRLGSPP